MAKFEEFLDSYEGKIQRVKALFGLDSLKVIFDKLSHQLKVDQDLLYFDDGHEFPGVFIFGTKFYASEMGEQEFKRVLGHNSLNFKILSAYKKLSLTQKQVKVSDILNEIQDEKKDSLQIHGILRRILTLSYYLNWNLKKDDNDFEGDSVIEIPDLFMVKLKQRFNFEMLSAIYEDKNLFFFMNSRGKLNIVFKNLDFFTKEDVEKLVIPVLKKVFDFNDITTSCE